MLLLLNPIFKIERTKTERRKQPAMYSGKLKVHELNE